MMLAENPRRAVHFRASRGDHVSGPKVKNVEIKYGTHGPKVKNVEIKYGTRRTRGRPWSLGVGGVLALPRRRSQA